MVGCKGSSNEDFEELSLRANLFTTEVKLKGDRKTGSIEPTENLITACCHIYNQRDVQGPIFGNAVNMTNVLFHVPCFSV